MTKFSVEDCRHGKTKDAFCCNTNEERKERSPINFESAHDHTPDRAENLVGCECQVLTRRGSQKVNKWEGRVKRFVEDSVVGIDGDGQAFLKIQAESGLTPFLSLYSRSQDRLDKKTRCTLTL